MENKLFMTPKCLRDRIRYEPTIGFLILALRIRDIQPSHRNYWTLIVRCWPGKPRAEGIDQNLYFLWTASAHIRKLESSSSLRATDRLCHGLEVLAVSCQPLPVLSSHLLI